MGRERFMLFQRDMVLALLAGTKTNTRRLDTKVQAGDTILCREAWRAPLAFELAPPRDIPPGTPILYEADGGGDLPRFNAGKLRPSMFMPRWAVRLRLDVSRVVQERLQDISEADAQAEGVERVYDSWRDYRTNDGAKYPTAPNARSSYQTLWERINGYGSWDINPLVFSIYFTRQA